MQTELCLGTLVLPLIMSNMGLAEQSNHYGGRNITFFENAVSTVPRYLGSAQFQNVRNVFDGLGVPGRNSQRSQIPRLKISTSGFREFPHQSPPLRRTVSPWKSHILVRSHFLCWLFLLIWSVIVYTTPVPHDPQPQEPQSRSWLWDYVHRVCGTSGLLLHREWQLDGGIEGEFKAIVYLVKIFIRAALVCKFNTIAVAVRRQDLFDIRNRGIFACVPNRYTHLDIH
jgi:hypothetical protein